MIFVENNLKRLGRSRFGHFWSFWAVLAHFGSFWVVSGHFWSFLVIPGHFWSFLVVFGLSGPFWPFLALSGRFWSFRYFSSFLTIFGHFWSFRDFAKNYLQFWAKIRLCLLLAAAAAAAAVRSTPKIDFRQELPKDAELGANFGRYPGDVMVGLADAPQAEFRRKSFLRFFGVWAGQF